MFDAEKLLGGLLLGGARRKSGLNALVPGGAGMALLGEEQSFMEKEFSAPADVEVLAGQVRTSETGNIFWDYTLTGG